MYIVVDIGNSRIKYALCEKGIILQENIWNGSVEAFLNQVEKQYINGGIYSSVRELDDKLLNRFRDSGIVRLTYEMPLPIFNSYTTPQTLGMDRVAAAVGAWSIAPNNNILIIDAGTAITFDFVTAKGVYVGGNISPGRQLRFMALHRFTSSLPMVEGEIPNFCWGDTTERAILSGVINGIRAEIEGYISRTKENYDNLLVFLTGGDENIFEMSEKKGIFAVKNLVIRGLEAIYRYNEGQG